MSAYGPKDVLPQLNREGGFAKANRYQVLISTGDATTTEMLDLFAENITLPGKQIMNFDYSLHALKNTVKHPNGFLLEDISITFRLTNTYDAKDFFDKWQESIITPTYLLNYSAVYERDIHIRQLNEKNKPIYEVTLLNAYPITVSAIELNSESSNSISKLTVSFTYTEIINRKL